MKAFKAFDVDNNGSLTREEFKYILECAQMDETEFHDGEGVGAIPNKMDFEAFRRYFGAAAAFREGLAVPLMAA